MLTSRIGSRLTSTALQALIVCAALAAPLAGTATAQTPRSVRVVSRSAAIHVSARLSSDVLMSALRCSVFEVMDKEGNWYWIYLPRDTFGVRRPGWVSALDVEITTEEPCKDLPTAIAEEAEKRTEAGGSDESAKESAGRAPSRSLVKAQDELEQARRQYEKVSGLPSPELPSQEPAPDAAEPSTSQSRPTTASR